MAFHSVFEPNLFADQVVLVTGGGTGIGRCTAFELASLGAQVVIAGRRREKLEETCAAIEADHGRADWVQCDIREEDQVRGMIAAVIERHGHLDGLVNNAGGQFRSPLEGLSKNAWEAVVRTNLTGPFLVSREAFSQYFQGHGGAIVNVLADFRSGMPFMAHSGAARAGMRNLTMTASIEWAKCGVRVNAVAPGIVESTGLQSYEPSYMEKVRGRTHKIPLKRFATESEVSGAIVFLLSRAARYITGALLPIDGGLSLRGHTQDLDDYPPIPPFDGFSRG